ncbi:sodium-coupled monocarboxylate transporter 2 [Strongylocentrotus purpuratus]|uniref:Sodium-coupled monocarboxylate transporter 2 n=1 Tax=Strongylocentrotus purpuratus TaxID=7668 RepID=A0A7M7PUL7_STRPU|nr:sodium-coupled monocarboxylate transporter 2 [Strongylocentrotus purpuratus]
MHLLYHNWRYESSTLDRYVPDLRDGFGVIAIIVAGTNEVGGMDEVWARAKDGGRISFFDTRPDLTIRNSFWSVNIGAILITYGTYGMNQAIVQRCLSLGSIKKAKWAISLAVLSQWVVLILMSLSGVVMYAYYFNCDPFTQGKVLSPDQIMPYMVMEVFAKMPGIPGIFLSSVLSASLSTLSSGLNALAAVAGQDIIKGIWPRLEGKTYTAITKLLSFLFGLLAIGVAFLAMVMGDQVLEMGLSIYGITYGAVVATFTLGFCCPRINYKGVLLGTIVSISTMTWLKVGKMFADNIRSDVLPLSVEGCVGEQNSTNLTYYTTMVTEIGTWTSFTESPLNETVTDERTGLENFYSLSYHLYGPLGFLITIAVAFIVSAITGFNDPDTIDKRLLINVGDAFCCCLPTKWQKKLNIANGVIDDEYPGAKTLQPVNGTAYAKIPVDLAPNQSPESEHFLPQPQYFDYPQKPVTVESRTTTV